MLLRVWPVSLSSANILPVDVTPYMYITSAIILPVDVTIGTLLVY